MVNLSEKIENKLLFGIRASVSNQVYGNVNNPMWRELYGKVLNQTGAMRNISSIVNTKLTKIVVVTFESKIDNVSYIVDFRIDTKLSYLRTSRLLISAIGKQIWYKVKSIRL